MPIGLRAEDFLSLLAGSLLAEPATAALDGDQLRLTSSGFWSAAQWLVRLIPGQSGQVIGSFSAKFNDGDHLEGVYGLYASQPVEDTGSSVWLPHRLDLKFGAEQLLTIRYEEVRLGFPAQESMFPVTIPQGFSVVDL
jgi:hypothetical protein